MGEGGGERAIALPLNYKQRINHSEDSCFACIKHLHLSSFLTNLWSIKLRGEISHWYMFMPLASILFVLLTGFLLVCFGFV